MGAKSISRGKIKIIVFCFYLFFLLNIGFLIRWQIFEHDRFMALARERIIDNKVPSIRGEILASDGSALAYSEPRFDIIIYKTEMKFAEDRKKQTRSEFVEKVSNVLEIDPKDLEQKLDGRSNWFVIKEKVKYEVKEEVLNLTRDNNPNGYLFGLRTRITSQRIYPENELACHVVGYVGKNDVGDEIGSAGLEYYWEGVLKEQEGFDFSEVDSFGNLITIDSIDNVEAKRGASIRTTIDKKLQTIIERHLEDAVKRYDAKSGTVIIMEPKTGAIMALANYPEFNPNEYYKVEDIAALKNLSVTDPAELGSIGKVFTVASAIEAGAIQPNTPILEGHKGCTTVKENERDWEICTYDKKPQGGMNTTQSLVKSDNLALYEISKMIGQETLFDGLRGFGVGSRTDIDVAGESNGIIKDVKRWTNVDSATYSFGHGYQMTSIQAITGIGAIANNGKLVRPYLVSSMTEADGKQVNYPPVIVRQVVSADSAQKMKDMLYEVYKDNLDERRYKPLAKYKIGMKSGTALIPYKDRAGYSSDVNATYVGFDGSDKATFIMLVKLEEPKAVERLSYYSARIVWLDIFDEIKDYLGVPAVSG